MGQRGISPLRDERILLSISFLAIILLYLPAIFLNDIPDRDTALRYAPAAEAFARGDWFAAFHPRIQILHPLVAGLFAKCFLLDGFLAAKCSSCLFFALSLFPFYFLMKNVFNEKIARFSILIYLFSSRLAALSYSGLRETHKQFAILLLALGMVLIWKNRTGIKEYVLLGIACGFSVCARNDIILFSALIFFACSVMDAWKNRFPWRSVLGFSVAFAASLPEFYANYAIAGYFLPGARFFSIFRDMFHQDPNFRNVILLVILPSLASLMVIAPLAAWLLKRKAGRYLAGIVLFAGFLLFCRHTFSGDFVCNAEMSRTFARALFRGTIPLLAATALPGILYRIIRRKMTVPEILLLILYAGQGLLIVLQIVGSDRYLYVSSRYLVPAVPLYFGWCWFTYMLLVRFLREWSFLKACSAKISVFLLVLYLCSCCFDSWLPVLNYYIDPVEMGFRTEIKQIAGCIRSDYKGPRYAKNTVYHDAVYFPNVLPLVFYKCRCSYAVSSYLAGGTLCTEEKVAQYVVCPGNDPPSEKLFRKIADSIPSGKYDSIQVWRKK